MDIPDYLTDPNPDKQEWIIRKILSIKWELRRTIEEVEYLAEQYQMKKKYNGTQEELEDLYNQLKDSFDKAYELAVQIRNFT